METIEEEDITNQDYIKISESLNHMKTALRLAETSLECDFEITNNVGIEVWLEFCFNLGIDRNIIIRFHKMTVTQEDIGQKLLVLRVTSKSNEERFSSIEKGTSVGFGPYVIS